MHVGKYLHRQRQRGLDASPHLGLPPGHHTRTATGQVQAQGIKVSAKAFTPADLEAADEVFITSTTRDLLPVFEVEGKKEAPSSAARQALARSFGGYVGNYVAEHRGALAQ